MTICIAWNVHINMYPRLSTSSRRVPSTFSALVSRHYLPDSQPTTTITHKLVAVGKPNAFTPADSHSLLVSRRSSSIPWNAPYAVPLLCDRTAPSRSYKGRRERSLTGTDIGRRGRRTLRCIIPPSAYRGRCKSSRATAFFIVSIVVVTFRVTETYFLRGKNEVSDYPGPRGCTLTISRCTSPFECTHSNRFSA
jgi:hypothetical protein